MDEDISETVIKLIHVGEAKKIAAQYEGRTFYGNALVCHPGMHGTYIFDAAERNGGINHILLLMQDDEYTAFGFGECPKMLNPSIQHFQDNVRAMWTEDEIGISDELLEVLRDFVNLRYEYPDE